MFSSFCCIFFNSNVQDLHILFFPGQSEEGPALPKESTEEKASKV